jgi:hypothetical protein
MSIFKAATAFALPVSTVLAFSSAYAQSPSVAASLGVSVYPSNGQTREQQSADESECYAWAQQSTGVDPSNPAAPAQAAPAPQGSVAGAAATGAFRGAAKGYLLAEVTDNDTGDAARAGAVVGASRGARSTAARNQNAQAQAKQQQEQQTEARMQSFKNGFSACMTGRKYTAM